MTASKDQSNIMREKIDLRMKTRFLKKRVSYVSFRNYPKKFITKVNQYLGYESIAVGFSPLVN
jgi:hypothetical protein